MLRVAEEFIALDIAIHPRHEKQMRPHQLAGMYYRRKRKPSDPINNLSLTANTICSWGCGSVTEEWDSLYAQKVQLFTFLSTLPEPALSYGPSVETNMDNSIEQREQKKSDIIVLDWDDDDESTGAHKQLTPEKNKQLIPSEQAGALMRVVIEGIDESFSDRDQNCQIVPYSPSATLMNQYPSASYQPSAVLFERVILQNISMIWLRNSSCSMYVATHKEKMAETQVSPPLPKERKNNKLIQEDEPMGEDEPMEEEHIKEKESDGLEDFWNEHSVTLESSKLDTLEEAANEKEVNNVCNHEIQIHEDLGHVCRMIVRRPDTIIDYQWRKVCYLSRSYYSEKRSKDSDDIVTGDVRITKELNALDIVIHLKHEKQMRPHQLVGFHFLVKNLVSDKPRELTKGVLHY
ncbi:hypothetical protein VPH35_084516 [Triticum aestivum]